MVANGNAEISMLPVEVSEKTKSSGLLSPSSKQRASHGTDATSKNKTLAVKTLIKGTRLCKFHLAGTCDRGAQCSFAHSLVELQQVPDLKKTRLCTRFRSSGKCRQGAECKFAHGVHELRQMPGPPGQPKLFEQQDFCPSDKKQLPALPTLESYLRAADGVHELRQMPVPLGQPELFEQQDVCPSAKSRLPALPTLEPYLGGDMFADGSSAGDACSDVEGDTKFGVARTSFENSQQHQHQPRHQQQWQQTWARDHLHLMMKQQEQLVLQSILLKLLSASHAHAKDKPACLNLKGVASVDTLQSLQENTETTKNKEYRGQLLPQTCYKYSSDMHIVTVKHTFIHVAVRAGPSNRSKSVPASMKLSDAGP